MSQLSSSIIDLAPDVKMNLEEEQSALDAQQSIEQSTEPPVEQPAVDPKRAKLELEMMNEAIAKERNELATSVETSATTFPKDVPADIIPEQGDENYAETMEQLRNYNKLGPQEKVDLNRKLNRKKRLEKPSSFNILAPIKFGPEFIDFKNYNAGEHYKFAFDASSIKFNDNIKLYERADFIVTGYDIKSKDEGGVVRNIVDTRYAESPDGTATLVPSRAIQNGGLLSFRGKTSEEKAKLLNTVLPSVSLYAVPPGIYEASMPAIELGITENQLKENGISLDTEFLAFSIDGLRQQRLDATAQGYVDASGNSVVQRNSKGEIEKYTSFSKDLRFAQLVNANPNMSVSQKQELIAMYNDNLRAGLSRGDSLNDLGVFILNGALAASETLEDAGATVSFGLFGSTRTIPEDELPPEEARDAKKRARNEAVLRLEEDKEQGNYVIGSGFRAILASEADPLTGLVKPYQVDSIIEQTAKRLGVDTNVLRDVVSRNFSFVEDMVDYSLDPTTYMFGAAGVGIINFVRYYGGPKKVAPYIMKKYRDEGLDVRNLDDVIERVYKTRKNGVRQLESDIVEAAEAYAAETIRKGLPTRILRHPILTVTKRGTEEKISTVVTERAAQSITRTGGVTGIVVGDEVSTLAVRSKNLSKVIAEETDENTKAFLTNQLNIINNRKALLEKYPKLTEFDLKYGKDIKDEAFALAGMAAANRYLMNITGEDPDLKTTVLVSLTGGIGGMMAASMVGDVLAGATVKSINSVALALVGGNGSIKSINAALDTHIEDPKLRQRVKKEILRLSKKEFIKLQDGIRQYNDTVDSIMKINDFIPEGGEKLEREDVKVAVYHLFGVGLEGTVDSVQASRAIDLKNMKDMKGLLKLKEELLKRDKERSEVVSKVINSVFPHQDNLSESTLKTLNTLNQVVEAQRVTREQDLVMIANGLDEIRRFAARSSGLGSTSSNIEANVTLRDAIENNVDRGDINPQLLDDEELSAVVDNVQKQVDEIIAINKENHRVIKEGIDNVANRLDAPSVGADMRNTFDNSKLEYSKRYTAERENLINDNVGVVVVVDDFRSLTNANAQYRELDFTDSVNLRSRAENVEDILDDPEDLMSDSVSRETNPNAYNEPDYLDRILKDSKDQEALRAIQKLSVGPTGIEKLNAAYELPAKRALLELSEGVGEDNSYLFLSHTHKLFLSLPEKLKQQYPIRSGRFIEVYDWHKKFSKDLAEGKIDADAIGENAQQYLDNLSTFAPMKRNPAEYSEALELELNFKEVMTFRDILRRKRNSLINKQGRERELETVQRALEDIDATIIRNSFDTTSNTVADGRAILDQIQSVNDIWRERSIRFSSKHKGDGFENNGKSSILKALENKDFPTLQNLVVKALGGSTNTNNILLETFDGQTLVKLYGGVRGQDGLYYPTEETADSLRFILHAAFANSYLETEAGKALVKSLKDSNVTSIPGVFTPRGFEIIDESLGVDPTGATRLSPLLKTTDDIEAFHQNIKTIPIYSVGKDGKLLVDEDGIPTATGTLDDNSDIIPFSDINVIARTEPNRKEIKKATAKLKRIEANYRISHNVVANKLMNIHRGFDPSGGNKNYDDIMGESITDQGFNRWSNARELLSEPDKEKWDQLSSDLLGLHISKLIRGNADDEMDFLKIDKILDSKNMVDNINKIDPKIVPALSKLKELGDFLYPPTHPIRTGTQPIPFRPESMFSKVYGLKNNKVSPTFVAAEFSFRANKQRKFNAQSYLIQHPEFAEALVEYAQKRTVMNIDVGKDHLDKVLSYSARQAATQSFYSNMNVDYLPKLSPAPPASEGGNRLPTPDNPQDLLNQLDQINMMKQQSLQTQGAIQ